MLRPYCVIFTTFVSGSNLELEQMNSEDREKEVIFKISLRVRSCPAQKQWDVQNKIPRLIRRFRSLFARQQKFKWTIL